MAARRKMTKDQARKCLVEVRQDVEADEDLAKAALDIVNNYYWSTIRGDAADFLKRAKEGEFESDEQLSDLLREYVDSHYWVTYTYWSRVALVCTNEPDAYEDEFGEKPPGPEQAAYAAIMNDISNHPDMQEAFEIARSGGEDEEDE